VVVNRGNPANRQEIRGFFGVDTACRFCHFALQHEFRHCSAGREGIAGTMSELGSTVVGQAPARPVRLALSAVPIGAPLYEALSVLLLCPILMSVAVWNGFPIIFYDTGAYMLQGLGHVFIAERSPVYSLFLEAAGGRQSLWFVAIAQCAMTSFVMTQFARALRPSLSLYSLLMIGTLLALSTGLPWYAGQIEPDCFVALVPLSLYLLAFHTESLGSWRLPALFAITAFAIASHPSHIGLSAGLLAVLVAARVAPEHWVEANGLPRPHVAAGLASFAVAIALVVACNYAFTQHVFLSRSGAIFLEARMMEDGLIAPVLDAECPKAGYRICAYKNRLPARADAWLWEEKISPFHKLGGFSKMEAESAALVAESLRRYPLDNFIVAVQDALVQFFWFQTGDGIVPQEWVLNQEFKIAIPQQVSDYDHAYQQEGAIWFLPINLVQVPVAFLTLLGLYLWLRDVVGRRAWRTGLLPSFVLLALLGNAFVCGVFSGPHGRYQSRIMWLPAFALLLMASPRIEGELRDRFGARADGG
jgi:hypothetical protein